MLAGITCLMITLQNTELVATQWSIARAHAHLPVPAVVLVQSSVAFANPNRSLRKALIASNAMGLEAQHHALELALLAVRSNLRPRKQYSDQSNGAYTDGSRLTIKLLGLDAIVTTTLKKSAIDGFGNRLNVGILPLAVPLGGLQNE